MQEQRHALLGGSKAAAGDQTPLKTTNGPAATAKFAAPAGVIQWVRGRSSRTTFEARGALEATDQFSKQPAENGRASSEHVFRWDCAPGEFRQVRVRPV